MAYGYCDSCQKFTYRQNNESICERTGSYTNENGKCKQYLPNMTYFEALKNLDISYTAKFIAQLVGSVLLAYEVIDEECYSQTYPKIQADIQEILGRQASDYEKT